MTAGTNFCAGCLYAGFGQIFGYGAACQAGPGVPGACICPKSGVDCAASVLPAPVQSFCAPLACGFACTPDGATLATFNSAAAPCP